jgi:hypothetical protein
MLFYNLLLAINVVLRISHDYDNFRQITCALAFHLSMTTAQGSRVSGYFS